MVHEVNLPFIGYIHLTIKYEKLIHEENQAATIFDYSMHDDII